MKWSSRTNLTLAAFAILTFNRGGLASGLHLAVPSLRPSLCTILSATKLWGAPVSTKAIASRPLMATETYSSFLAVGLSSD